MRTILLAAAALCVPTLAACDRAETPTLAEAPGPDVRPETPPQARVSYVGVWAASPDLCEGGAWRFEADRLTTAGGVACDLTARQETLFGWRLSGTCRAEGPPQSQSVDLVMDPALPDRMTVRGGPFAGDVVLNRCPVHPEPRA